MVKHGPVIGISKLFLCGCFSLNSGMDVFCTILKHRSADFFCGRPDNTFFLALHTFFTTSDTTYTCLTLQLKRQCINDWVPVFQ